MRMSWITFTPSMWTSGIGRRSSKGNSECGLPEKYGAGHRGAFDTQDTIHALYPQLAHTGSFRSVLYHCSELEDMYPTLAARKGKSLSERAQNCLYHGIGDKLRSGKPHDLRSPDYDDWSLNGDILFWYDMLGCAMEISSMGIRVDPEALDRQLTASGCDDRRELMYHRMLMEGKLPLTIGGGIGQSRLSMLILRKAHIGEVQASVWDEKTISACQEAGIMLL